jgi:hypothetical protein
LVEFFNSEKRWIKNDLVRYDGKYQKSCCLLGAVMECYKPEETTEIENRLKAVIARYAGRPRTVPSFNDDANTTFKDIQRVVRLAEV